MDEFRKICPTNYVHNRLRDHINRYLREKIFKKPYLFGFKKGHFDLVYGNTIATVTLALHLKKAWGVPVIMHVHQSTIGAYPILNVKKSFQSFDSYLAVSELTKKMLIADFDIDPTKITIQYPISYWVNQYMSGGQTLESCQIGGDSVIIGLCSYISWIKSSDLFPFIIKRFFTKYPEANCKFVFICRFINDTDKIHFEYDLEKLGVQDKNTLIEDVNPLPYYKRFDIFLMPSREESFSLSAQEAALMETPVVGFEGVTGAEEWLKNEGAIFVPYLDIEKLTDALYLLFSDKELRHQLGSKGKHIVMEMLEKAFKKEAVVQAISRFDIVRQEMRTAKTTINVSIETIFTSSDAVP